MIPNSSQGSQARPGSLGVGGPPTQARPGSLGVGAPAETEETFLAGYDPKDYPSVALTVDLVVFAVVNKVLHVAVVERGAQPFLGKGALPGGFVQPDEDALTAANRELAEETGLDLGMHRVFVEQLATFSAPQRDPRMRVVSVAHLVLLAGDGTNLAELRAGTDASDAQWLPVHAMDKTALAFDHADILAAGLERLAGKMEYTTIAAQLVPEEFTLSALRDVYAAVWQAELPAGNFTRKMRTSLTPTGRKVQVVGAPASLFTVASQWISPPWSRP